VRFSARVPGGLVPNRLASTLADVRRRGAPIIDLTESNPTRAGFEYPSDLLGALSRPESLQYAPESLGLPCAREAVSADFSRRGINAAADRIALTASTSEAYSLLFKILCDPDDEVLVPRPSYPLFEHLTRFEAVVPVPYDLEYHGAWSVNLASVQQAISDRTRALLVVNPNNPTGNFVSREEVDRLAELSVAAGASIVADEVFADYPLSPGAADRSGQLLTRDDVLGFTLGGLSKSVGLPQVKLGWIAVGGPDALVQEALARLELVCDTYLSVSTPVQAAAGELLHRGASIRRQIHERVLANYRLLTATAAETPACRVLQSDGGWYAVVQVPSYATEDDLVVSLLTAEGVLTHPGYFFDFPAESFLVVSLLVREDLFADGISRVLRHFDCGVSES
jgi:aspartate/methionine/tyrosine aminotransferase